MTCVHADEQLLDVLRTADEGGDGRILVLDNGRLSGIVSPTDVSRAVQAAELEEGRGRRAILHHPAPGRDILRRAPGLWS